MAASIGRGARLKGSNFEREIANWLSEKTGIEFKRGLAQSRGGGGEVADVTTTAQLPNPVHFELKRQIRCNIKAAYAQACEDSPENYFRVVITKEDRAPTLVTMELSQWVELFNEWLKK